MKNIKYKIILGLLLISLASSLILSFGTLSILCGTNSGCEVVHFSQYNYTLGIQNSYYGIVFFSVISLLTLWYLTEPDENKKALINLAIIIGTIVVLYFLYIQIFVLHAYCQYCLVLDSSVILCFLLIISDLKKGIFNLKRNQ